MLNTFWRRKTTGTIVIVTGVTKTKRGERVLAEQCVPVGVRPIVMMALTEFLQDYERTVPPPPKAPMVVVRRGYSRI